MPHNYAAAAAYPIQPDAIASFVDEHRFLSNFWYVPGGANWNGLTGPTVEHVFQAAKTIDPHQREAVLRASGPMEAKRIGRQVHIRPDWDQIRIDVMRQCLASKFSPGSNLAALLVSTGERQLVEGNHWGDRFWGVDTRSGRGENHLGELLMQRRSQLLAEPQH